MYRCYYGRNFFFILFIFSSERYHLFFSFAHFLNKIVKPKCKTPFSKLLEGCICYTYLLYIKHSKLRGLQKYIPSKNNRLQRLWRSSYAKYPYRKAFKISIPPLLVIFRDSSGKIYLLMCFGSSELLELRKDKKQEKKFKSF